MEKERKTIKCSYAVLVIVLFAALAFVTDYAIIERKTRSCSCPKCDSEKVVDESNIVEIPRVDNEVSDNNTTNQVEQPKIINVVENNDSYPQVTFYVEEDSQGAVTNTFIKINDRNIQLSEGTFRVNNITVFKGMVIFLESMTGNANLVVSDSNGNVIKRITPNELKGRTLTSYKIENNSIYIMSSNIGFDAGRVCVPYNKGQNDEIKFVEKINYLGDNSFDNIEFVSSQTLFDFVNSSESTKIECSKDVYK